MLNLERKGDVRNVSPAQYVKERIESAANALNKAGQMAVRVELANEALCKLAELCYQKDTDGLFANVDNETGRIRIALPWGSKGWKVWGLRHHEADKLGSVLLARQQSHESRPMDPLFVYDGETRYWCLNHGDYPNHRSALMWLKHEAITLAEWRK